MIPSFGSPTALAYVTEGWGEPRAYRHGVHEGLDFRAPVGTNVRAVGDGTVVRVGKNTQAHEGWQVAIKHGDSGLTSQYFHLSRIDVENGQRVSKGQVIGLSGDTGGATGKMKVPHLHFQFKMLESKLADYVARFGMPKGGWGSSKSDWGVSVPAEPLVPLNPAPKVQKSAMAFGLPFYRAVGFGLGGAVLIGLAAFWFFVWRKRS
jgi:murein DD-endopeptidase MepM/ murein hydrolase activator NlpD